MTSGFSSPIANSLYLGSLRKSRFCGLLESLRYCFYGLPTGGAQHTLLIISAHLIFLLSSCPFLVQCKMFKGATEEMT